MPHRVERLACLPTRFVILAALVAFPVGVGADVLGTATFANGSSFNGTDHRVRPALGYDVGNGLKLLFDNFWIDSTSVGSVLTATADSDTAFNTVAAYLTNGTDDAICVGTCEAISCGFWCTGEAQFFGISRPDLGPAVIEQVSLQIDDLTFGRAPRGDQMVSFKFTVTVEGRRSTPNVPPIAVSGGPYHGSPGLAIAFDGSASRDPDGDALRYSWDFGDGASGSGPEIAHAYSSAGTYRVILSVSDGIATRSDTTTAEVLRPIAVLQGRAFVANGDRVVRLGSEKPTWCVQVEPIDGSFDVRGVDLRRFMMIFRNSGAVQKIQAIEASLERDTDRNGVPEITVCFSKEDVRQLFSTVVGRALASVTVHGDVPRAHAVFDAPLLVDVVGTHDRPRPLAVLKSSDGGVILNFETSIIGPARLDLFDLGGRRVGRPLDILQLEPGLHEVRLGRTSIAVRDFRPGVYFYRLQTAEGRSAGRVTLLR